MSELIKKFEGLRLKPYLDEKGIPTIGYGTIKYPDGSPVKMTDPEINENQACMFLENDLKWVRKCITDKVKVPLHLYQKTAIGSLIYNIGETAFNRSTLLRMLNLEKYAEAADCFFMFDKITINGKKIVSEGLAKRRMLEREWFLKAPYSAPIIPDNYICKKDVQDEKKSTILSILNKLTGGRYG